MNKLITFLSPYNGKNAAEANYKTDIGEVKGYVSSEPVVRYLSAKLSAEGKRLDEIVAIVSDKVKNEPVELADGTATTSYEYFCSVVSQAARDSNMIEVPEKKGTGEFINDICMHISPDDVIYIDTTGGFRRTTNMLQLLTKILKYKGISNPVSYYANLQEKQIETTDEFVALTELADGVNEFVTTGRSDQLGRTLKDENNRELTALFDSMQRFTDNIRLCSVESLDDDLKALKNALDAFESSEADLSNTKTVVLRQLIPVIREKFFGSELSSDIDYCRIVSWCLDNGLVQQALTVFTEKMSIELFRRNIISVDEAVYKEVSSNRSTLISNTETELFYSKLMSAGDGVLSDNAKALNALERHLNDIVKPPLNIIKTDKRIEKDLAGYLEFEQALKTECEKSSVKKAINRLASSKSECVRKRAELILDEDAKKPMPPKLSDAKAFEKFINMLNNNKPLKMKMLDIEEKADDNSNDFTKKFKTAASFEEDETFEALGFSHRKNVTNKQIADIMYGYIYVKSIRNSINHASDEKKLSDQQADILRKHNYRIGGEITCSEISANIRYALERITSLN